MSTEPFSPCWESSNTCPTPARQWLRLSLQSTETMSRASWGLFCCKQISSDGPVASAHSWEMWRWDLWPVWSLIKDGSWRSRSDGSVLCTSCHELLAQFVTRSSLSTSADFSNSLLYLHVYHHYFTSCHCYLVSSLLQQPPNLFLCLGSSPFTLELQWLFRDAHLILSLPLMSPIALKMKFKILGKGLMTLSLMPASSPTSLLTFFPCSSLPLQPHSAPCASSHTSSSLCGPFESYFKNCPFVFPIHHETTQP